MSSKKDNISHEKISRKVEEKQKKEQEIKTHDRKKDEINTDLSEKEKKILELEEKIEELKKSKKETLLRAKAEIENMRKRNEQDIEKVHRFALEHFISELLPVIDNLERTIVLMNHSNFDLSSAIEGVQLTLKSFLNTTKKFGLDVVEDTSVSFNPEIHQAINTVESEEIDPNQVVSIIQKGYLLNKRLLRPAMVTVSRKK